MIASASPTASGVCLTRAPPLAGNAPGRRRRDPITRLADVADEGVEIDGRADRVGSFAGAAPTAASDHWRSCNAGRRWSGQIGEIGKGGAHQDALLGPDINYNCGGDACSRMMRADDRPSACRPGTNLVAGSTR